MKFTPAVLLLGLLAATACSDLPHDAPFDPEAPLNRQARSSLRGVVTLENESDHSQISVQLRNAERTYSVDTLPSGAVELTGIVPGRYELFIGTRYFEPVSESIQIALASAADLGALTLTAKRAAVLGKAFLLTEFGAKQGGVTVTLRRTGSLRGAGTAPGFARQAEATVQPLSFSSVSQSDGAFAFTGVPAGVYRMVVEKPGVAAEDLASVEITGEDGDVTLDEVSLQPMYGFVHIAGKTAANAIATTDVTLTLDATGFPQTVEVAFDPGFITALPGFAMRDTARVPLPLGDGLKSVYVRYFDKAGNVSTIGSDTVILDTTPPQLAGFTVDEGPLTRESLLHLNLSAIDAAEMRVSETLCAGTWEAFAAEKAYAFASLVEEPKTISVQYRDAAGNTTACLAKSILYDKTAPTPLSLSLAAGAPVTRFSVVSLTAAASDLRGVTEMQIANSDTFGGAAWDAVTTSTAWLLSPGEGVKTVYVRFRDGAGNVSPALSDTIEFDQTAPSQPSIAFAGGALANLADQRSLVWDTVNIPGVSGYRVFECEGYLSCNLVRDSADTPLNRWPLPQSDNDYSRSYHVATVYSDGTTSAPSRPGAPQWPERAATAATVLLVDDDGESLLNDGLLADLQALGFTVDVLEVPDGLSGPSAADLATYPVVIWAADESRDPLTEEDQNVLAALDADQTVILWTPEFAGQLDGHAARAQLMRGPAQGWRAVNSNTVVVGAAEHSAGNGLFFAPAFPPGVTQARTLTLDEDSVALLKIGGDPVAATSGWSPEIGRRAYFALPYSYLATGRLAFALTDYDWKQTATPTGLSGRHGAFNLALPFAFPFFGVYYNSVTISTHGFLTFQAAGHDEVVPTPDVSPQVPNAIIAGLWADLDPSQGGSITYSATPDALTVTYFGVPEFASGVTQSFQITLLPDGDMTINFLSVLTTDLSAVGIEDPTGTQGLLLEASGDAITNLGVRFRSGGPAAERLNLLTRLMRYAFAPPRARIEVTPSLSLDLAAGGATEMQISTDGVFDTELWLAYAAALTLPIAPADGSQTVWVRYRDAAGNESVIVSDTALIDTTPPQAATPIIGNGAYTNTQIVTVQTAALGAAAMVLSEDLNFAGAVAQPWAPASTYVMAPGEGAHRLYIRYIDAAGNSTVREADIVLDLTPPEAPVIATPSQITTGTAPQLTLLNDNPRQNEAIAFAAYEVQGAQYASWTPVAPQMLGGKPVFGFTLGADGEFRLSVRARDMAGNISPVDTVTITRDTQPPEAPVNLLIREGNGIANLAWTPSPSGDIERYRIYYGAAPGSLTGSFAAEGPSPINLNTQTRARLNGLPNNTRVFVGVVAVDRAGHESSSALGEALPNESTPEEVRAFDVADHLAVSVNNGLAVSLRATSFEVWDLSHPTAPVTLATVTPNIAGLTFTKGILDWPQFYAIDEGNKRVRTWNLSTPTAPSEGTSYLFPNSQIPYALSVTQGRVIVGGANQVTAYRRNATGSLTLLTTNVNYGANVLHCIPKICYAGNGSLFQALDTSSLAAPSLTRIGFYATAGLIKDLKVYNRKAYLAVQNATKSFVILDVANTASMQLLGAAFAEEYPESLTIEGPYAYIGYGFSDGVHVVDLSDAAHPVLAGNYNWFDEYDAGVARSVSIVGQHMLVGTDDSVRFVDLADPQMFLTRNAYPFGSPLGASFLSLDGPMLASGLFGYRLLDVSDPLDPQVIAGDNTKGLGLFLKNHVLYSTMNNFTAQAVTGAVPRTLATLGLTSQANYVQVHGQYAYVAEQDAGLRIANVANPSVISGWTSSCFPNGIGICSSPVDTYQENFLGVNNRTVFLTDNYYAQSKLWAIDVRVPATPYPAAATFYNAKSSGLCNQGNRIAWGSLDGFMLLDYDPLAQVFTQTGFIAGFGSRQCAFAGDYLYATWYDQLEIYDITDPAAPRIVATHPAGSTVIVTGNMVYLGDPDAGLITGKVEP